MRLRLPPLKLRVALDGVRGLVRALVRRPASIPDDGAADATLEDDAVDSSRSAAELLGYGLAMFVALSLVALFVVLAAPASGCGSRSIGRNHPAAASAAVEADSEDAAGSAATRTAATAPALGPELPPAAPSRTAPPPRPSPLIGDYECRFARGDRELKPVACSIRAAGTGGLYLEQAGGPVRLSGTVVEDEAGFRLSGEITCAAGPCPGPGSRDLLFFSQGQSDYSAVLLLRGGAFLNIDLVRKQ